MAGITREPTDAEKLASVSMFGTAGRSYGGYDSLNNNIMSSAMSLSGGIVPPTNVKSELDQDINKALSNKDGMVLDKAWLTNQIMIPANELEERFKIQAYKSTAHFKFQDTTIGGHRAVNAPPQFTRYCDIRANDLFTPWDPTMNKVGDAIIMSPTGNPTALRSTISFDHNTAHTGMGRFYAQALDDGAQELYLQFGVPEFNGLAAFFMGAISYEDAYIAKHGTIPSVYNAVNGIVKFLTAIAMPGTFVMSFLLKTTVNIFLGNKAYKYYYMKPNMHVYWSTVNQIANQIATAMGILSPMFMDDDDEKKEDKKKSITDEVLSKFASSGQVDSRTQKFSQGKAMKFSEFMIDSINEQFADGTTIFSSTTSFIDVYELATRYQNRVNTFMKSGIEDFVKTTGVGDFSGAKFHEFIYRLQGQKYSAIAKFEPFLYGGDIEKANQMAQANNAKVQELNVKTGKTGFQAHLKELLDSGALESADSAKGKYEFVKGPNVDDGRANTPPGKPEQGKFVSFLGTATKTFTDFWARRAKVFDASARLANSQVIFLVQPTGATSESFSNSTGEIQSGGIIKSFGKAAHDMNFNFAGGKTGIGFIDKGIDAAMQLGNSIIDNVTFGFSDTVRGLMMGAYVDVPKIWEDSSSSFPSITYSMDLVAPYGNAYSRFQNIVVPLSCLFAGALPLKVGKASYGSPFLCQAYCQGVQHIRLGLITDLSITRNNGNTQQTIDRQTNFVSVSFTITDLGSRIAAPVNNTLFNPEGWFPTLEEDTPFADYINALSGKHVSDIKWIWPSIGHNLTTAFKSLSAQMSPTAVTGALGNFLGNSPVTGWLFAYPSVESNHNAL